MGAYDDIVSGLVDPEYEAQKRAATQAYQQKELALGQSKGEIGPYYQDLLKNLSETYKKTRGETQESAVRRGAWHSGVLTDLEQKLGGKYLANRGKYEAEKARKLSNISGQIALLKQQLADTLAGLSSAAATKKAGLLAQYKSRSSSGGGGGSGYSTAGDGAGEAGTTYEQALQDAVNTYKSGGYNTKGFRENVIRGLNQQYGRNSSRDVYTYMKDVKQLPYVGR